MAEQAKDQRDKEMLELEGLYKQTLRDDELRIDSTIAEPTSKSFGADEWEVKYREKEEGEEDDEGDNSKKGDEPFF